MARTLRLCAILASLILSTPLTAAQSSVFVGGWAARTPDRCRPGQVDCGERQAPFRACCPRGQRCRSPTSIAGFTDNTLCCPTSEDCSQDLLKYNVCADDEWGLFNNTGYPFCCEQGLRGGIQIASEADSCRPLDRPFPSGEIALAQDTPDSRVIPTTSTTSISTSTSATPTVDPSTLAGLGKKPSASQEPERAGLTSAAIAGIVVGAIAGVSLLVIGAWLLRRRSQKKQFDEKGQQLRQVGGIQMYSG